MATPAPWDLTALLNAIDPKASRPRRHLWLLRLTEWLRHDGGVERDAGQTPLPVLRLRHLLNVLERHEEYRVRLAAMRDAFWRDIDATSLFADFGYGHHMSLWGELRQRIGLLLVPATPDTDRLSDLYGMLFPERGDAAWLRAIDDATLARLVTVLGPVGEADAGDGRTAQNWRRPMSDAALYLAGTISASGFSAALRQRMDPELLAARPFPQLLPAVACVLSALGDGDEVGAAQHLNYVRALLDNCRRCAFSISHHLETFGVSVDIVFEAEQMVSRTRRLDELLTCLVSPTPARDVTLLLAELADLTQYRRSIGGLFSKHYSLLARKVAERSAETGSHYITRTRDEYRQMLRSAAGGGSVIAATTYIKFAVVAVGMGPLWTGFWSGANYALSFVIIMLLHWTVATKQPAMTAPAMAAQLAENPDENDIERFVDQVVNLIRSQAAGIFGNLALVFPIVLGVQLLNQLVFGRPLVGPATGEYVLHSLTLLGPTALFAAFTGVLLFASSLVAGWVENAFVFHRLDSAIAWNPRIVATLGESRAQRWAAWWRANISGIAANVSLGMMLGLVPPVLGFFGLPLDVRHVTLSTGQLAAAIGALGWTVLLEPALWWCVAGIAVTGVLNLTVSFLLAFKVAMRSRGVRLQERSRIGHAIRARLRHKPASFLLPPAA